MLTQGEDLQQFTVISIDDHSLFRTGIELIVRENFPTTQFASFPSLGEALEKQNSTPNLVLLDLHLVGIGGHDAIPLLKVRWPSCAIIVLTSEQDHTEIERARRYGIEAVVLKSEPPEHFIQTIRAVLISTDNSGETPKSGDLSKRQLDVLSHLREGLSNKAIARRLGISEFTVRGHVQQILKVLNVSSRAQAVFQAQKTGVL